MKRKFHASSDPSCPVAPRLFPRRTGTGAGSSRGWEVGAVAARIPRPCLCGAGRRHRSGAGAIRPTRLSRQAPGAGGDRRSASRSGVDPAYLGTAPTDLASSARLRLPFESFVLYPPTQGRARAPPPVSLEMLGRFAPSVGQASSPPETAQVPNQSWLERDVRALINVHDLDRFESFLRFAVSRSGAILDQQLIADECGLSHRTVTRWLGVLSACFLTLRLPASGIAFGRRLIRSPKLHFLEGACLESPPSRRSIATRGTPVLPRNSAIGEIPTDSRSS